MAHGLDLMAHRFDGFDGFSRIFLIFLLKISTNPLHLSNPCTIKSEKKSAKIRLNPSNLRAIEIRKKIIEIRLNPSNLRAILEYENTLVFLSHFIQSSIVFSER